MGSRVWLISGSRSDLIIKPDTLDKGFKIIVVSYRDGLAAKAAQAFAGATDLVEALADILEEEPVLLYESRKGACSYYGCSSIKVPDLEAVARMLSALEKVLEGAPAEPIEVEDFDGTRRTVWSLGEAKAAAAIKKALRSILNELKALDGDGSSAGSGVEA